MNKTSIEDIVEKVLIALQNDVHVNVIRQTLAVDGFAPNKIEVIIRWAFKKLENIQKIYHIYKWSLVLHNSSSYDLGVCLFGFRDNEEQKIKTTPIVSINGRIIKTKNSTYFLEDADPEYMKWVLTKNIDFDPNNPIVLE